MAQEGSGKPWVPAVILSGRPVGQYERTERKPCREKQGGVGHGQIRKNSGRRLGISVTAQ